MARPRIEDIRSIGDFLLSFRWNVIVAKFPKAMQGFKTEDINFRCESATLPTVNGTSAEINIRGHKVKQPSIYMYSNTITLTLAETTNTLVHRFVKEWRELCWKTDYGSSNNKSDLEATLILELLDSKDKPVWKYELIGCYYESDDFGSLDATNSDIMRGTITLSYDYFKDEKIA